MRTFKIYFLSSLQICETVLLIWSHHAIWDLFILLPEVCAFWLPSPILATLHTTLLPLATTRENQPCFLCIYKIGFLFSFAIVVLLDPTYEWDSMVFVFLWLILLSLMTSRSICVAMGRFRYFVWLNNILLWIVDHWTMWGLRTLPPPMQLKIHV